MKTWGSVFQWNKKRKQKLPGNITFTSTSNHFNSVVTKLCFIKQCCMSFFICMLLSFNITPIYFNIRQSWMINASMIKMHDVDFISLWRTVLWNLRGLIDSGATVIYSDYEFIVSSTRNSYVVNNLEYLRPCMHKPLGASKSCIL